MRKTAITFLLFPLLPLCIHAQIVIENPDKPISKGTGITIVLKELLSIDDVGGDYYFKYPRNPKVAPDGSIFVSDHEQLLQFDRKRNFIPLRGFSLRDNQE